jgi:hypothetical protein
VDIYRLIKLCGLLVGLWVVQVVGLEQFRIGIAAKPPRYNVVDLKMELGSVDPARPLVEIAGGPGVGCIRVLCFRGWSQAA